MEVGEPQPFFSLTDYIEIVKVLTIFGAGQNQFDMIRTPEEPTEIKDAVAKFNIFDKDFITYRLIEIQQNKIKITPIPITNELTRKQIYFFVSRNISVPRTRLEQRLLDIYQNRAGTNRMGNKCFPEEPIRFPYQMPSRNKIFR